MTEKPYYNLGRCLQLQHRYEEAYSCFINPAGMRHGKIMAILV